MSLNESLTCVMCFSFVHFCMSIVGENNTFHFHQLLHCKRQINNLTCAKQIVNGTRVLFTSGINT